MLTLFSRFLYLLEKCRQYVIPDELKHTEKSLLQKKIENQLAHETFEYFRYHFKNSVIFEDKSREKIREYAIKKSLDNPDSQNLFNLEFGVFKGTSANFFSKYVDIIYAFDSFEGLNVDWDGTPLPKGFYNQNKKLPKLNSNVKPIVGWAEETIEIFLKEYKPEINFVHFDMDTYDPTKFTLEKIKPYLKKKSIIIFDNIYNYFGWQNGEFKALIETFNEDEYEYKAFNILGKQIVIQIK